MLLKGHVDARPFCMAFMTQQNYCVLTYARYLFFASSLCATAPATTMADSGDTIATVLIALTCLPCIVTILGLYIRFLHLRKTGMDDYSNLLPTLLDCEPLTLTLCRKSGHLSSLIRAFSAPVFRLSKGSGRGNFCEI